MTAKNDELIKKIIEILSVPPELQTPLQKAETAAKVDKILDQMDKKK